MNLPPFLRARLASLAALILLCPFAPALRAQQPDPEPSAAPIPVISGVLSFQSTFAPGTRAIIPEFDPVVLVPFGTKLLMESEYHMSLNLTRDHGRWGPAVVDHIVSVTGLGTAISRSSKYAWKDDATWEAAARTM